MTLQDVNTRIIWTRAEIKKCEDLGEWHEIPELNRLLNGLYDERDGV